MSWEVSGDDEDTDWDYYKWLERKAMDHGAPLRDRRNCLKDMRMWRDRCSADKEHQREYEQAKRACEDLSVELGMTSRGQNEPWAWRPVPEHLQKERK